MKLPLLYLILYCFLLVACDPKPVANDSSKIVPPTDTVLAVPIIKEKPIIPDYDTSKWVDIWFLDSTILIDMKYATTDNFVEEQMYECGRCFLRSSAAKALVNIHKKLQKENLGLKVWDCYRPRPIQQKLWDKFPNASYVTPPKKGSMHNRGVAIDVTIVDRNGREVEMGTPYDFFGKEAHHTYTNHSDEIQANRTMLKDLMYHEGFKHIRTEWWHYSYTIGSYELSDMLWNCPPPY